VIDTITFTPDPAAHDAPVVTLVLLNDTGTDDTDNITIDPTVSGTVTNDGPVEGLVVKLYRTDTATFDTNNYLGKEKTDVQGEFTYVPAGLTQNSGDDYTSYYVWAVAEEPSLLSPLSEDPTESLPAMQEIGFVENTAPVIGSLGLEFDTGLDGQDDRSSDSTLIGQLDTTEEHQSIGDLFVEFDHDYDASNPSEIFDIDGVALTDAEGNFIYLPPGLAYSDLDLVNVAARAVEWDDYANTRLEGVPKTFSFTYTETENSIAEVNLLRLRYENSGDPVADPTVYGQVDNDGPRDGILVELFVYASTETPDFSTVQGVTLTGENGQFEFTPLGLTYGVSYDIYARAVEWDPVQNVALVQQAPFQLVDGTSTPLSFTLTDQPIAVSAITNFGFVYDTGSENDDFVTANPTVKGNITYVGDMADVQIEFDLDGDISTIEATINPEETGYFEFTPEGLQQGAVLINARVRVPDYGVRLPEFANTLLGTGIDGELLTGWYEEGYNNGWEDLDDNGIPDANEVWLDEIFAEDGVTLTGTWLNSSFERDWTDLFADQSTSWQTIETSSEVFLTLDLSENVPLDAPTVSFATTTAYNPTITGSLADDGPVDGVLLEFWFEGGTLLDGNVTTDASGQFTYTFSQPTTGNNPFEIWVHEPVYDSEPIVRTFAEPTYTFSLSAKDNLQISEFRLLKEIDSDGDPTTREAIDATFVGTIDGIEDAGLRTIQFDFNGDQRPDGSTTSTGAGTFEFLPIGLDQYLSGPQLDQATVRARLVGSETDPTGEITYDTYGVWTDLIWTVLTNDAPLISQYELAFDTGMLGLGHEVLDRVTSDATLVGSVENDNGNAFMLVEFDHNGDQIVDGTARTDAKGYFRYTPTGLAEGSWDIRARVQEINASTGDTLSSDWVSITASGDPAVSGPFAGFTLVAPTPATIDTLEPLANNFDPTLRGNVSDADTTANLTIEFFFEGTGEILGTTTADNNGQFEFTPVGLEFTPFGGSAPHRIQARALETDFLTGEPLMGANSADVAVFDFRAKTGSGYNVINFMEITTESDLELTLTGQVRIPAILSEGVSIESVSIQYVEIGVRDNSGNLLPDSIEVIPVETSTESGVQYEFRYEPELASSINPVRFVARPVGVDENGLVFGNWSQRNITYDTQAPSIVGTQELDDLSVPIPTSATIEGTIAWSGLGPLVGEVELDFDGDGIVDDFVTVEDDGSYAYELANAQPGIVSVLVRAVRLHTYNVPAVDNDTIETIEQTERVNGEWEEIAFELASSAPLVNQLKLVNPALDAQENEIPLETIDPTLSGVVTSAVADDVAGMTVEIDHNRDGVADGTTIVFTDGTFEYTAEGLNPGSVELFIRVIDSYTESESLVGSWQPFTFELKSIAPPVVSSLVLTVDEDLSGTSPTSSNPELTGNVTVPEGITQLTIEFDYQGPGEVGYGLVDGSATVDLFGNFTFSPSNLPYGNVTIRARAVATAGAETIVGAWSDDGANGFTYAFFHKSTEPAVISQLEITDATTASISGRATVGGFGESVLVEVQVVGSAVPEHNFIIATDADGSFEFDVPRLAAGSYEIEVRGLVGDPNTGGDVAGDWRALSQNLIYTPHAVTLPTIASFQLAYNTGDNLDANITADPTLNGMVNAALSQLFIEFDYSTGDGEQINATVAVLPDGTFTHTPEGLINGDARDVSIRTKLWDPNGDQYLLGSWSEIDSVTFTLDQTENTPASVQGFSLWQNAAPVDQTPQSASPIFIGSVDDADGNIAGLTVQFDHNGDGIIDGTAITKVDGSFLYEAVGLEPGVIAQTVTVQVLERDYWGDEYVSPLAPLTFILTKAPLVSALTYAPSTVTGRVVSDVPTTSLVVEYQLFGNGAQTAPPDLTTDPSSWENFDPSSFLTTTVDTSTNFSINTSVLGAGPATILVRATDGNTKIGPWQVLNFTVGVQSATPLAINSFGLLYPEGVDQASDPTIGGTLGAGVEGAFGIVEISVENTTDPLAPSTTYRTTADASGTFFFTPTQLLVGQTYDIVAKSVVFDAATSQELFGSPVIQSLTMLANQKATILISQQPSSTDSTVAGTISNDGRIGGLRVEYDLVDGDGNVAGNVDGATFTDGNGDFSFTPYGISQGISTTIRIRVVEWDPVLRDYMTPDWSDPVVVSTQQFILSEDGPTEPALEGDLDDELAAAEVSQESYKDAVFSLLGELGLLSGGADSERIDLMIGNMQLLHKGGAGDAGANLELTDTVFQVSSSKLHDFYDFQSLQDYELTTSDGGTLIADYTITRDLNVDMIAREYDALLSVSITIDQYTTNSGADALTLGLGGNYTFLFQAQGDLNVKRRISGSSTYSLTEEANFDYLQTETFAAADGSSSGTRTTPGDYAFSRTEGTAEEQESGTFTRFGTVSQPFSQSETIRIESWYDDSGSENLDSPGRETTRTWSTLEHTLYVETTTVTGGQISTNNGSQTAVGTISVDASALFDRNFSETLTYANTYADGNYENGNDSRSEIVSYNGTLLLTTTEYADGVSSTQQFDLSDSQPQRFATRVG